MRHVGPLKSRQPNTAGLSKPTAPTPRLGCAAAACNYLTVGCVNDQALTIVDSIGGEEAAK